MDDIALRRFGRDHERPCKRPEILTCARSQCQQANACQNIGGLDPDIGEIEAVDFLVRQVDLIHVEITDVTARMADIARQRTALLDALNKADEERSALRLKSEALKRAIDAIKGGAS